MVCPACGSSNVRSARICATCGTVLSDVKKTQFDYQVAELPEVPAPQLPKSKNLSIASLVLGLAALTPATFITGIPAVICGAVALKQRRLGRRMAIAGVATGAFGTLVLTFAVLLPLMARQRELSRVAAVQRNMHAFQAALEDYAGEHDGRYPYAGVSWEPQDEEGMVLHFKAGGQSTTGIPVNPYTGERYQSGRDFFYAPEDLAESGLNTVVDRADSTCPYAGRAAPGDVPGTIVILGWTPPDGSSSPVEYAVAGYGRDTGEPLAGHNGRKFFVLHN